MLTNDELVAEFYARPLSQQKAFLRKVSPRGAVALSRDEVYPQTWGYLTQSATIEGEYYDEWLMNLTMEDLEAVGQRPTPEILAEFERTLKNPKRELTEEELDNIAAGPPKQTLSLLAWTWTTQGWDVYKRDGKEKFFIWAIQQTKKLITFKEMNIDGLSQAVRQRLGREKREHPFKGDPLRYACDAKDDFLMAACFTWKQIPGALRHKRQRRFGGDAETFYRLQHIYINGRENTQPRQPNYRIYRHPSCLRFVYISK